MAPPPPNRLARDIILARRARFVASALGALGLAASPAAAQPRDQPRPPPEPPPDEPKAPTGEPPEGPLVQAGTPAPQEAQPGTDPEGEVLAVEPGTLRCPAPGQVSEATRQRAKEHLRRGITLHRNDARQEAAAELRLAYELSGNVRILATLGKLELDLGHLPQAREDLERFIACQTAPDDPQVVEVEVALEGLRHRTGRMVIALAAPGSVVRVDGRVVATTPTDEPVFLTADYHVIEATMADGRRLETEIGIDPNGQLALTEELLSGAGVQPCLSIEPCLRPDVCLSIDEYDSWADREGLHVGLSLAPQLLIQTADQSGDVYGGGLAAFLVNLGFARTLELRMAALIAPGGGEKGFVMPVGSSVALSLGFSEHFATATSLSWGYLLAPEPSRAQAGAFEPSSSFFLQPELSPLVVRFGGFEVDARVGLLLSSQEDLAVERFGLSYVSTSVWLTYLFLPACSEVEGCYDG